MIRIVGYARVSTREQAEYGFNLDEQVRRIDEYVGLYYEGQDIEYRMFREEGASARSLNRPKLQEVLTSIKNGEVDIMIIHNLDRLTRKLIDMNTLLELLEKYNVSLISLNENIDTDTPHGRLFISMMALIAQWEEDTLTDRTKRGMYESARQGNYAKPKIPLGYKRDPENTKKLIIDKEGSAVVKRIFRCISEGTYTPYTMAKKLREDNVLSRKWTDASILAIIQNKIYYGTFEWHGEEYTDHTPVIIEKEIWDKANEMAQTREFRKYSYLFKNKIHCANCVCTCEQRSTVKRNGALYLYYRCPKCRTYINENCVLQMIETSINSVIQDHHRINEMKKIRYTVTANRTKRNALINLRSKNAISEESFSKDMNEIFKASEQVADEYRKREKKIKLLSFMTASGKERNTIMETYVDYINIDFQKNDAEIRYTDEYKRVSRICRKNYE